MDGNYNELIDNFTDSMHPHFVHKGVLYDDSKRQPLNFDVHRLISKEGNEVIGLEATSYNEKIDMGNFIFNMISPKENVTHHERYFVPIIHQVEYSIANIYIFVTFILTPENENRTRVFQVYSLKSKCPKWITGPIIKRVLNKLLVQDKYMLELQADNIRNIGGRHFYYTKIDMLSFHTKIFLHHLELGNSLEDIKYQDKQYDVLI